MFCRFLAIMLTSVAALTPLSALRAQGIPVIDVAAIAQLLQQISYWQQQIAAMDAQITQLKTSYDAITGNRGMEGLLPYTLPERNYLPEDYAQIREVLDNSSGGYGGLASNVYAAMTANAVLSEERLSVMSPEQRQLVEGGRRSAALLQGMSQQALQNTSQRFFALQQLITMVGLAGDDKAIQDLQGRISAEEVMLQNEQSKLQTLYQLAQSERLANDQQIREEVISGQGVFETRFQPTPP